MYKRQRLFLDGVFTFPAAAPHGLHKAIDVYKRQPIDSNVVPYPWDMPGYQDKVIMAAGSFIQGSSIELSADAPIKKPYVAYFQGGLTLENIKLALMLALTYMKVPV